jgi:hypothetical protein
MKNNLVFKATSNELAKIFSQSSTLAILSEKIIKKNITGYDFLQMTAEALVTLLGEGLDDKIIS